MKLSFVMILGILATISSCAHSETKMTKEKSMTSTGASSGKKIWIYKEDGTVQCEGEKGRPLEQDQKSVEKAGIKIFASKKTTDGKMRIQMCGSPTGNVNAFEILASQEAAAKKLGFRVLKE